MIKIEVEVQEIEGSDLGRMRFTIMQDGIGTTSTETLVANYLERQLDLLVAAAGGVEEVNDD